MKETFSSEYMLRAPHSAVRAFHESSQALKHLSPPLIPVQVHKAEPLAEGSMTEFTLWFGPIPIRWKAQHRKVGRYGFTDVQRSGPFKSWAHSHRYVPATQRTTLIEDHIEYEHHGGIKGTLTRLLFSRLSLRILFAYRRNAMERKALARRGFGTTTTNEASEALEPLWHAAQEE